MMRVWLGLSAVVVGWVFFLEASSARPDAGRTTYPVMILGFDGMDPEFFDYFLSQGKLPNFRRLVDEGAYAPLQTFKPTKSVVLWTSVATGKRMEKHGIIDWQLLSEDGRRKVLASGQSRRTEAIWNIATDGGKTVQVLNWWATWPAEAVSGEIVSNHFPRSLHADVAEATYPPALADELAGLGLPGREDANRAIEASGMPVFSRELADSAFMPSTNFRARFQTAAGVFNDDMITEQSLEHLIASRGQADLVQALFRTIDVYTHFMWRFIDRHVAQRVYGDLRGKGLPVTEELSRTMDGAYARVLEPVYVHEDRRLGRLMEQAGPDTVLIVLSDHGFQFRNYGFNHYDDGRGGVRAPSGVLFLWGPPVRAGAHPDHPTLFDIAPTVLYLMGLPAGRDMDGRVLTETLEPTLMAARAPRWVPTHDDGSRLGGTAESPVDEEVLRELEALGYLPNSRQTTLP